MVEKASIEDVMRVLIASGKQEMQQLWSTCSHLVAKSGLPPEVLAKHLPIDVVAKIEEIRHKSSLARSSLLAHHHHRHDLGAAADLEDQKIRRAADVNYPAGAAGRTPLHIAAEMVSPDMVSVLLDHHADPNVRTADGITPLDILRTLTSDFLFKGAIPGLAHIEPNKLRLCLELVQSAAMVISREEDNNSSSGVIYPTALAMNEEHHHRNIPSSGSGNMVNLNLDSRLVYLNLGAVENSGGNQRDAMTTTRQNSCDPPSMYHHSHEY
nr:regulatory protein NPR5-like [Ipomoea batatas]